MRRDWASFALIIPWGWPAWAVYAHLVTHVALCASHTVSLCGRPVLAFGRDDP